MNKIYQSVVVIFLLIIIVGVGYIIFNRSDPSLTSVQETHEYQATSTADMSGVVVKAAEFNQLIKASTYGSVTLGSVVVASTTGHTMSIYNATSTDGLVNGDFTLITRFPTSTTQGTYVFDIELNQGLVVRLENGFAGDYVFTYR